MSTYNSQPGSVAAANDTDKMSEKKPSFFIRCIRKAYGVFGFKKGYNATLCEFSNRVRTFLKLTKCSPHIWWWYAWFLVCEIELPQHQWIAA